MRWVRRGLVLALLVGVMIVGWRFAAENQQPVRVHYVFGELSEQPLWRVLLGTFGAGAALVGAFALFSSARNGLVNRRYRKALGGLEAEVHQLRNLPLAPESDARDGPAAAGPARAGGAFGREG